MTHSGRVGPIDDQKYARWMTAHAHELKDCIPRPPCTWSWSDTELSLSHLRYLKNSNLILRVGNQWETSEKCIEAIAAYGRVDNEDDIGVLVCGDCQQCKDIT